MNFLYIRRGNPVCICKFCRGQRNTYYSILYIEQDKRMKPKYTSWVVTCDIGCSAILNSEDIHLQSVAYYMEVAAFSTDKSNGTPDNNCNFSRTNYRSTVPDNTRYKRYNSILRQFIFSLGPSTIGCRYVRMYPCNSNLCSDFACFIYSRCNSHNYWRRLCTLALDYSEYEIEIWS